MAALGDTFQLADRKIDAHLHVIISDPARDPDHIVTANFTSWRADKDQSCVVQAGDHKRISHRSCVDYRRDTLITLSQYERLLQSGSLDAQDPVSDALLNRILDGAAVSPYLPLRNRQILADQGLIDRD